MIRNKLKVLLVHGLAAKPAPDVLKQHVMECLPVKTDELTLLYWADLAGWMPRVWNRPGDHRPFSTFEKVLRRIRGSTRQFAREATEHIIAVAFGLDPVIFCDTRFVVPPQWFAVPVEKAGRALFGTQLSEMSNYFCVGSELRSRIFDRACKLEWQEFDVVIGHSMGSLILVDLLEHCAIKGAKHLVTLGSPLGLSVVQYLMHRYYSAARPLWNCYTHEWLNVSDPLDIVSLDSTLNGEYEECAVDDQYIENDAVTPDGKRHYHSLYGYLRSKPVQQLFRRLA